MLSIHFRTAFSNIRRSPFQAMAAVFVLTITFLIATVLAVLVYSSNNLLNYFETRPQVIAFLKDEATAEQITELQLNLKNDARVKEIKYVTKEEALGIYKQATSDNPLLSELVSPSIFPASVEFSFTDLAVAEAVIADVEKDAAVAQVGYTANLGTEMDLKDSVNRLKNISWYIRIGGGVFVGLLLTTSFLVLLVIIGMRMFSRRQEVEILGLIGATPGFIRGPILIEAVTYALFGVFTGWVLTLIIFLYTTPSLMRYFKDIPALPENTAKLLSLFGTILSIEVAIGIFLALAGTSIAVARSHKAK